MKLITKVFVYGTLKEGHSRAGLLQDSKSHGVGQIKGYMFHLGGFPALVLAPDGPAAYGEVYDVDEQQMSVLDGIEGVPDYYQRLPVYVPGHGACWVYVMPIDRARLGSSWIVPTGAWLGPESTKQSYFMYLQDRPHLQVPGKPATLWDHESGQFIVNQFIQNRPIEVIGSREQKALPAPQPVIVVPSQPDEKLKAPPGLTINWA